VSLQQLVDNLCAVADGVIPNKFGKLPFQLTLQSELLVEASFTSSYGSHIIASNPAAIVNDSPLTIGLTSLTSLLDDDLVNKNIKSLLEPLGVRCATRYRVLLEQMAAARVDIEIHRASPNNYYNTCVRISKDTARHIADCVKAVETELSDQYKLPCTITAFDSTQYTFSLEIIGEGSRVSGKVEKEAIPPDVHVTIKERYIASIRELSEINPITGEEKKRYTMTRLENWYEIDQE
jgi:hypothetical protein